MQRPFRVAILAIAADEAAYLAQFVFHHLRLGFGPIVIISNNSQDGTPALAAWLAAANPDVIHINADAQRAKWPQRHFQVRAYRLALRRLARRRVSVDYVACFDIDEFWLPLNGAQSVSDFVAGWGAPDSLMTNWVIPDGDQALFSHPFRMDFSGLTHDHMKMIWRYGATITKMNPHAIWAPELRREVVVSGLPLVADVKHATAGVPDHPGSAMIVHQMYRSPVEYLATLGRGSPGQDALFKSNRWGYRRNFRARVPLALPLASTQYNDWSAAFARWVAEQGLTDLIYAGQRMTIDRAARTLDRYLSLGDTERSQFAAAFSGLDLDVVRQQIAAHRTLAHSPAEAWTMGVGTRNVTF